ncbi:helix-turn-helix domain-containing protein [Sutcliffiella cohnii]
MIGDEIKKLRNNNGLSLSELAEKSGVSKSYLSQLERNLQVNPSLQLLSKIATSLDTDIEELLNKKKKVSGPKITLDAEWRRLLYKAISEGMTKEDFVQFRNYLHFKKWQETKRIKGE